MIHAAWLCVLCLAVQDAPPPGGDVDPILSGPEVRDRDDASPSLVGGMFGGAMDEVIADPAFEALLLIDLTNEQQDALDGIMADRWGQVDRLVREQYGLILEFSAAATARNQDEIADLLPRVRTAFAACFERGTVIEELSDRLTKNQIAEAQRLVREYVDSRIDNLAMTTGSDVPRRSLLARVRLESFGRQVAESVDRQIGLQRDNFEQLAEELLLTEEQKQKVQAIYQPLVVQQFQGKRDRRAEAAAMIQVLELLTAEQRRKLIELRSGRHDADQTESGGGRNDLEAPTATP